MLIFDHSRPGRTAAAQLPAAGGSLDDLPPALRRKDAPALPKFPSSTWCATTRV